MSFNENSRVKIPAILHLCRLGFQYLPLLGANWDKSTNIFTDIFEESITRINPTIKKNEIKRLFEDISLKLDNEDLGKDFYEQLISSAGTKLIDFECFEKNTFHVVTELPYKNDSEFRPDITLLVNGMPLAFIEVKKPNNEQGIQAERDRIHARCKNKKFRKFMNISQILVFSNNMEYDNTSINPLQGAFYATSSYHHVIFNYFREEDQFDLSTLLTENSDELENLVLKDNNLSSIKGSQEFITNKSPKSPTHRMLTSVFSKDRFKMFLKYGITYVQSDKGLEKHIMRYPQLFATRAIERKLNDDVKKGIIWHTQGSGKTSLAYFNVRYLTDYFQKKGIIPKFYFIVDRIDLMNQSKDEFTSRGLIVHTVNSKESLVEDFRKPQAIHNFSGNREITVVNIQKFTEDQDVVTSNDYDLRIQRIYFLDEVHRSYDPKGSFLANLLNSDRNAIIIGLTGTPLISSDRKSKEIFGDYIHKYYYNASIKDGYTLRLMREEIETQYKIKFQEVLKEQNIKEGEFRLSDLFAHPKFVEPMLDYIIQDFIKTRVRYGDHTIGSMVVCESAEQARKLFSLFIHKYNTTQKTLETFEKPNFNPELPSEYKNYQDQGNNLVASLILHDIGEKDDRKREVDDFKEGNIDILFVYNMLLTGFDAKRLKKLYIGRVIKNHNLLQTLTRVNRPYHNQFYHWKYGYVVDFADISQEFDRTNQAYYNELKSEVGDDEAKNYSNLFKSSEEIETEIKDIQDILFAYDTQNAEIFSQQISNIQDRQEVLKIKQSLDQAKNLYNTIRAQGNLDLIDKLDFQKLNLLYHEVSRHLELLNFKDSLDNQDESSSLLNVALENIFFMFHKIAEEEMIIADELKDILQKTRESLKQNIDKKDPRYVTLYDELKRIFHQRNLNEITQEEMRSNIHILTQIYNDISTVNHANQLLEAKYHYDPKFVRLHKRIVENGQIAQRESEIYQVLIEIKNKIDDYIHQNIHILDNENYFGKLIITQIIESFRKYQMELNAVNARFINQSLLKEYTEEYQGH